jgi:hypothetical protein
MPCDPEQLMSDAAPLQAFWPGATLGAVAASAAEWSEGGGFDPTLCKIGLTDIIVAGDKFDCYEDESPITKTLNAGEGFPAAWVIRDSYFAIQALDTMESYSVQDPVVDTLNGGYGYSAAWSLHQPFLGIQAIDTMESYAVQDPITDTLNSGQGFTAAWSIHDH